MNDSPILYTAQASELSKYPDESVTQFCKNVTTRKIPPSQALRSFIKENAITDSATGIIYDLLNKAYPGIQLIGITFPITDSNYPFGDPNDLDDDGFDALVKQAIEESSL